MQVSSADAYRAKTIINCLSPYAPRSFVVSASFHLRSDQQKFAPTPQNLNFEE